MKHFYLLGCLSFFFLLLPVSGQSQNIEQLGLKKGVKVSGSVNLNTVGYTIHGTQARRNPFDWFATGNLNLSLFGYAAPFSFSYSNAGRSYSQPFNQLSFAPQYKWVKTYIGYTSMTFSPYTLSGHIFLGGGVELTPGKWRLAAMYGRLKKPVAFHPVDSTQQYNAAFRRMGYGLKGGYESNGNTLDISVFCAKDDIQSIPYVLPRSSLSPKQNLALSLGGRKQLGRFFVQAEYAFSSLVNDLRAQKSDTTVSRGSNFIRGLLPETATNRYYDAFNGSTGYAGSWYGLQIKYERIAPEYHTLGAYYFNNDLQNITFSPNVRLLNNTLSLIANAGIQHNNLDKSRTATTRRWVSALNASYAPTERWNFTAGYSNFSTYTNMRPQTDPFFRNNLDTLNFYQISNTANATVIYQFGPQKHRQSLLLGGSYQKAADKAGYAEANSLSDFYSANAAYSYTLSPIQTVLAAGGSYNRSNSPAVSSTYWGPSLNLSRTFLDKTLRSSLSGSYNQSSANGTAASDVWNMRGNISYSPREEKNLNKKESGGHQVTAGLNMLRRFKGSAHSPAFTEWTATAGYTYNF
jgi:hypothetical protein